LCNDNMLYIWELSNKFDLNQTTRVLHILAQIKKLPI
jgi:hypothetical protein